MKLNKGIFCKKKYEGNSTWNLEFTPFIPSNIQLRFETYNVYLKQLVLVFIFYIAIFYIFLLNPVETSLPLMSNPFLMIYLTAGPGVLIRWWPIWFYSRIFLGEWFRLKTYLNFIFRYKFQTSRVYESFSKEIQNAHVCDQVESLIYRVMVNLKSKFLNIQYFS